MRLSASLAVALGSFVAAEGRALLELKERVRNNFGQDRVLSIAKEHLTSEIFELLHAHGADHFGDVDFKLSPEAVEAISNEGNVDFEDTTEDWIKHFEDNFSNENFVCHGEDCAGRDLQDFYSQYQELDALHDRARTLAAGVDFAEIGSIGKSYEGRDQLAVFIGDHSKPLVFYWCNIHAREWLTPMYCSYMVETLLADGGHPLLETFSFTVVISANPDGYAFTHSDDNMWRKTRRPNPGSRCVGTDPNRNYDFYHCGEGTSNNPCSDVYCGPNAFSEIEVANIRDYATANAGRLVATNDVHAYGGMWMFPYGAISKNADEPDYEKQMNCTVAAVKAVQATSGGNLWRHGPIFSTIYPAAGSSVDWLYVELGVVYAMTAEVRGNSFQPSASNIMPSNVEIFNALQASLSCIAGNEGLELGELPPPIKAPVVEDEAPCNFFFC